MQLFVLLDLFARSGGGGSGGGSGGAGLGLFALGYYPSLYIGKFIKKHCSRMLEVVLGAVYATIVTIILLVLGLLSLRAGLHAIAIVIGVWCGWGSAFFGVWERIWKRAQKTEQDIAVASQTDQIWNKANMLEYAKNVFMQYQSDWSTFNINNMQKYLTSSYAQHNLLLLRVLRELGRTNRMSNIVITNALIMDMHDDIDNSRDSYTVAFEASAQDELIENATGKVLFKDKTTYIEQWTFVRNGNGWLLGRIDQETANIFSQQESLQQFAHTNSMFYSLDMGWLFLPRRGVLFRTGKFGTSDINNHVVGTYNNHLVQLYTYDTSPASRGKVKPYIVAQVHLPKQYGGIVVQPDKGFFQRAIGGGAPNGYTKYEFEWTDFNKRYDVFATDADRLATFELLNPGFMAYLYDNDPQITIEVTDNIVYLYKSADVVTEQHYTQMLNILLKAFKELKL